MTVGFPAQPSRRRGDRGLPFAFAKGLRPGGQPCPRMVGQCIAFAREWHHWDNKRDLRGTPPVQ